MISGCLLASALAMADPPAPTISPAGGPMVLLLAVLPTAGAEVRVARWAKLGLSATGMASVGPVSPVICAGSLVQLSFGPP